MGELLDVFREAVGEACLDGLDDLGMQRAPPTASGAAHFEQKRRPSRFSV